MASGVLSSMLSRPRPCSGEAKVPLEDMVGPALGHVVAQGVVRTVVGVTSYVIHGELLPWQLAEAELGRDEVFSQG